MNVEVTLSIPEPLYREASTQATKTNRSVEDVLVNSIAIHNESAPTESANYSTNDFERYAEQFYAMRSQLAEQYPGKYVAIYENSVVAIGNSRQEVTQAIDATHGAVPVFVEHVDNAQPQRIQMIALRRTKRNV